MQCVLCCVNIHIAVCVLIVSVCMCVLGVCSVCDN